VSFWRHVRAVALLPGVVAVAGPAGLVALTGANVGWGLPPAPAVLPTVLGGLLIGAGFGLWTWTVRLLARQGEGTLAPWDPTSRLVVEGPYRRVRHPMISAVAAVLLGEALVLGSLPLVAWFAGFTAVNALYLPLVEEPGLVRRFGREYEDYRDRVPRWVPRVRG
jgi:protein-S-isoprenylcysteine O-methyltransferase Ste14